MQRLREIGGGRRIPPRGAVIARRQRQEAHMPESVWTTPAQALDADTARQRILLQHQRIRVLLQTAQEVADRALDGEEKPRDAVASAIGDIRTVLEVHLSFEETVLVPILNDDLPLGPQRAQRLHDEHRHQRAVIASLHREATESPQLPLLATKLAFLARWLLDDMGHEERALLNRDVTRDDVVVIDQDCG
jgi:hypothetical protein